MNIISKEMTEIGLVESVKELDINNIEKLLMDGYHFRNEIKEYLVEPKDMDVFSYKNGDFPYYTFTVINQKLRRLYFPNVSYYYETVKNIMNNADLVNSIISYQNKDVNNMNIDIDLLDFGRKDGKNHLRRLKELKMINNSIIYKIDIENYYESIYTHNLENADFVFREFDELIRALNANKTNGIIMGPTMSIFAANIIMQTLCEKIQSRLFELGYLDTSVEYFSDQFYIISKHKISDINLIVSTCISDSEYFYKINLKDSYEYDLKTIIQELNKFEVIDKLIIEKSETEYDVHQSLKNIISFICFNDSVKVSELKHLIVKLFNRTIVRKQILDTFSKDRKTVKSVTRDLIYIMHTEPSIIVTYEKMGVNEVLEYVLKDKMFSNMKVSTEIAIKEIMLDIINSKKNDELILIYYTHFLLSVLNVKKDYFKEIIDSIFKNKTQNELSLFLSFLCKNKINSKQIVDALKNDGIVADNWILQALKINQKKFIFQSVSDLKKKYSMVRAIKIVRNTNKENKQFSEPLEEIEYKQFWDIDFLNSNINRK